MAKDRARPFNKKKFIEIMCKYPDGHLMVENNYVCITLSWKYHRNEREHPAIVLCHVRPSPLYDDNLEERVNTLVRNIKRWKAEWILHYRPSRVGLTDNFLKVEHGKSLVRKRLIEEEVQALNLY
jgi:hypothetical protein